MEERYQVYTENSQKELQELSQKEQAPLMDKLQKAIQSVGAKNGFTYIIEKNAAPYIGANAVDAGTLVKTELGIK